MDDIAAHERFITPQMLRDRAAVLRQKADAMMIDAGYTDSSQSRLLIEDGAWEQRRRAAVLDAEADTLERDLAGPPKELSHA